jgi:Ca2+-binding RTX toxin-like protein
LTGNAGKDAFVFDTRPNARTNLDKIVGFSVKDDTILLDNGVFTKIGRDGLLKKGAFHIGAAAHDKDDRIIFNKAAGEILYDQDGTGAKAAVVIAKLDNASKLALTFKDFFVI